MKRTGEILKKAREEKRLSLHEVALFLKINSRVLQAIEEGDQSQLPARTFLRGFVQSYAKFLKLDTQAVLQVFSEETSPPPPAPPVPATTSIPTTDDQALKATPDETIQPAEPSQAEDSPGIDVINLEKSILTQSQVAQDKLSYKTIAVSIIGLLLVGVLYFANSVIKKYQKEAEIEPVDSISALEHNETISQPMEDSSKPAEPSFTPKQESTQAAAPAPVIASPSPAQPAARPTPPAAPTPLPANTQAHTSTPAASVMTPTVPPTTAIVAKPKLPEKSELKPIEKPIQQKPAAPPVAAAPVVQKPVENSASTTAQSSTTEKEAPKPEGKPIEVIVEAHGTVEIEYSSAKTSPQKMTLKADQIHTFKSRSGVRLKISNGGAVNIIMNGRDLGVPGAAGQPVQVTY